MTGGDQAHGCAACGAKSEDVQREKALHYEAERQHQADTGGLAPSSSAWTVLLAPPERFHKPFAAQMRKDMGTLEWHARRITVIGRKDVYEFKNVFDLALVRQPVPWLEAIVVNLVLLAMVFGGFFQTLTANNPFTWVLLVAANGLLLASSVLNKWVRVTYRDKSKSEASVYLLPVTSSGWRRFDGASRQLITLLTEEVLNAPRKGKKQDAGQE